MRSIDSESNPSKETVGDAVAEEGVLEKGVDSFGSGLLPQNAVLAVEGKLLGIGVVGLSGLDIADQVLVEEGLADVARADVIAES